MINIKHVPEASSIFLPLHFFARASEASFPLEDTCFLTREAASLPLGSPFSERSRISEIINGRGKRVYIPFFTSFFSSSAPSSALDALDKYSNQRMTLRDVTTTSACFILEKSYL